MKSPIFLIGYMAAGKSTIGKLLASQLNVDFIDIDKLIEQKENVSVDYIFEEHGEKYFRDAEADFVLNHDFKNAVVSTGGGLPCFNDNMAKLVIQGETVYLNATADTISERLLKTDLKTRPLLKGVALDQLNKNITEKLAERSFYYEQAKHIIDTNGKTVNEIVEEIVASLT